MFHIIFSIIYLGFSPKKIVPTVKKNYSILSTVFCSIFFDDFLELLFSPFTKNFASAVNKEIKFFLYQTV